MLLRPNLWPYFVFDVERAFAVSWDFNIFVFLITTFLLFMLLTANNFWVSVFGSVFIFLSGAMQWWSYGLASFMIYLNVAVISIVYLLYSRSKAALAVAAGLLLISSYSFITSLYPPWQVPLGYLYVALLGGFLVKKRDVNTIKENLSLRVACASLVTVALLLFLYHYYGLVSGTYQRMMSTAYPGHRVTSGGDLVSGKLFSEFFGIWLTATHCPGKWLNICEASGFIMLFPVIFYSMIVGYYKTRRLDWQWLFLAAYIVMLLIWVLIGYPSFLSRLTLLSMSPSYRTLPVLGVANCILAVCFVGTKQQNETTKVSWLEFGILTVGILIGITAVVVHINRATENFFSTTQLIVVTILMTVAYLLIRYHEVRFAKPALALLLLGMNASNIAIHPLTSGLSSVLQNPLVTLTKKIRQSDAGARWAVFGSHRFTNLLKANGTNVINGVKVTPPLNDLAVLDPSGKDIFIYNRYAHIIMAPLIDMKDSVVFTLNEDPVVNDRYTISMDPCSPRLKELAVKYLVFTDPPKAAEVRCMTKLAETSGISVYKRNDE
jgi:hypothetical protein